MALEGLTKHFRVGSGFMGTQRQTLHGGGRG